MSEDAPQHNYPYRWGSETIVIQATEESAEEIMDHLNQIQSGDSDV